MAAKKLETTFDEFFHWMWEEAQRQGMAKGYWMEKSGTQAQRWAELARGCGLESERKGLKSRHLSVHFFYMLSGGLNLSVEEIELKSGIKFSDEQREELQLHAFVKEQRIFLLTLMRDKKKLDICKSVCQLD